MLESYIKLKNFKLSTPSVEMTDSQFMSSYEKGDILKKWVAFLSNHFKPTLFNKKLYQHLSTHCGYIAHYNADGFYGNYFESPAQFHWLAFGVKKKPSEYDGYWVGGNHVGVNAIESKEAFLLIYEEIKLSRRVHVNDARLSGFFWMWGSARDYIFRGDYGDLNSAMKMVYEEYVAQWEKLVEDAEQKRIREEIKSQRARVNKTLTDAAEQLEHIEREVPIAMPKKSAQFSLLDFLLDDEIAV